VDFDDGVVVCDLNGSGIPDFVAGAGLDGAIWAFFADDPSFAGGVFVGRVDVNGDSVPDINIGAGAPRGGAHVKVFSG
jgi:hypothetical protein